MQEKVQQIQEGMRALMQKGISPEPVRAELEDARAAMQAGRRDDAEAALDRALSRIGELESAPRRGGPAAAGGPAARAGAGTLAAKRNAKPSRPASGETIRGKIVWGDIDDRGREQLFLASGDSTRRTQLTSDPEGGNWSPAISPDGTQVAYVHKKSRDQMEIRVIRSGGSDMRRLTEASPGTISMTPAWSPDGKRIAYAHRSCRPGAYQGCNTHIRVMDADGNNKKQISFASEGDNAPSWSPDGREIAFFSMREGGHGQIWTMNADGGNPKRLTEARHDPQLDAWLEQKVPAWSPDGKQIAFWQGVEMSDPRPTGEVPRDIWVMDADGRNPRLLVTGDNPVWSPDASTVIFPVNLPAQMNTEPIGMGAISSDGSNFRVVLYTNGHYGRASWGP